MPYVYKAVRLDPEAEGLGFRSLYDVYPVKYRLGAETSTDVGGLICYSPEERVFGEVLSRINSNRFLLRCRVSKKDLVKLPSMRLFIRSFQKTTVRDLWEGRNIPSRIDCWQGWPENTVAYRKLTPVSVVDPYTLKRIRNPHA